MKLRREVELFERPPSVWFIYCWHDFDRRTSVFYPFGIHWIAKWIRAVHWWLNRVTPNKWERMLEDARERGLQEAGGEARYKLEHLHELCERQFDLGFLAGVESERESIFNAAPKPTEQCFQDLSKESDPNQAFEC